MDAMRRAASGETVGGGSFEQAASDSTSEMPPCHVGVIFALDIEASGFERMLAGKIAIEGGQFVARQGGLHGKGVVVVHSGPGSRRAASAAETLIAGHKPRWIISAGLAGGLQPQLRRGDIVMASELVNLDEQRLAIDLQISADERAGTPGLHTGALLTADRVVCQPSEKRALGERYRAVAVDMETFGVAEACRREKQRFLSVRAISDGVDDELPADVERLLNKRGAARKIGAAAGSILRRPKAVKDLWNLRSAALDGAERLAKFLDGVIAQLD